ncbi:Hsp20/alpha crystallin family protein [Thaumasiovibrio sp. DFM-14]|uniref:Hsp20/alpha crystallin family protein n=1 Tax=Thaumasiovibrio sp. DFM-14 TaxID=3384792 RepID=UPI0039A2043D
MSLVPRDYWTDFNRMFEHAFPSIRYNAGTESFSPRVDIIEQENQYQIAADLPGVDKKDLKVRISNGTLFIEATTSKNIDKTENGKVVHKERYNGKMMRSFFLGNNIQQQDIKAEFKDGVLHISVPKVTPDQGENSEIEIN